MRNSWLLHAIVVVFFFANCTPVESPNAFVQVEDGAFVLNGESYQYTGTNFWYGAYIGQKGELGNRQRLQDELDILAENGMTNLRVLGSSEESVFENSLTPTFINTDGSYNESLLVGLDYLLSEMAKRDMKAVVFLNNYWEWSGGMSIYNAWYSDKEPVDPSTGDWDGFMKFSAEFYKNESAQEAFRDYIKSLLNRENSITGVLYKDDPTIMSWQLANEPRPGRGASSIPDIPFYVNWIDETAGFIKSLAPNQLTSSGSEGRVGSLDSMEVFIDAHDTENIDYLTFHMWAKNWGWYDAQSPETTFPATLQNAEKYILDHIAVANDMGKPIVMEEFGLARDSEVYDLQTPTTYRDQYFNLVFGLVEEYPVLAGTNIWSWGGLGEKQNEDARWRPGDPFTGDPPQEPQGLNSVFASDSSTLGIIRAHAKSIGALE